MTGDRVIFEEKEYESLVEFIDEIIKKEGN